jgi:predicted nucleic acid-binding protein
MPAKAFLDSHVLIYAVAQQDARGTRAEELLPMVQTHETALRIAEQYSYGIYDALIAAAALEAGCVTLYSEDFQNG